MSLNVAVYDLEVSGCREKEHVHEMQELLNQGQQQTVELYNHIELRPQSSANLIDQQDTLQKPTSCQENQLHQFAYV
jgi:hypothetical protein